MATGRKNNRSLQVSVRLPLDDLEEIEKIKEDGESTAGFLITAAKGEIKRRQRRKTKTEPSED